MISTGPFQSAIHHGMARTLGASHSSVSPVCSSRPALAVSPYSARKMRRLAASSKPRPTGRLDFDGQQASPGLDDKVHFLTDGGTPVEDLGVGEPCVAPGQKVVQHDVLQMSAPGTVLLGEVEGHAGITPIHLRRLDQPFGPVDGVGRKPHQQVRCFQQVQVAVDRCLGQGHVAAKLRLVQELSHPETGCPHETAKIRQRRNRRDVLQVPLQVGTHVSVEPDRPFLVGFQVYCRGREAAAASQHLPVVALGWPGRHQIEPVFVAGV